MYLCTCKYVVVQRAAGIASTSTETRITWKSERTWPPPPRPLLSPLEKSLLKKGGKSVKLVTFGTHIMPTAYPKLVQPEASAPTSFVSLFKTHMTYHDCDIASHCLAITWQNFEQNVILLLLRVTLNPRNTFMLQKPLHWRAVTGPSKLCICIGICICICICKGCFFHWASP